MMLDKTRQYRPAKTSIEEREQEVFYRMVGKKIAAHVTKNQVNAHVPMSESSVVQLQARMFGPRIIMVITIGLPCVPKISDTFEIQMFCQEIILL